MTGVIRSATDCSDGGLAVALAECYVRIRRTVAPRSPLTASRSRARSSCNQAAALFGESASRVIVSASSDSAQPSSLVRRRRASRLG